MRIRSANLKRITRETTVRVQLRLDGSGKVRSRTGIGFLDHMLSHLGKHGGFDLDVFAKGDLHVDRHHTNEDVAIVLGEAFRSALGDKRGIARYGDVRTPMDEALTGVRVSLDLSGRGSFYLHTNTRTRWLADPLLAAKRKEKDYSFGDARHFLDSFARNAGITLHADLVAGQDTHHVIESIFKTMAVALRQAVSVSEDRALAIPSTKGRL